MDGKCWPSRTLANRILPELGQCWRNRHYLVSNEVRSALTALIDAERTLLSAVERNQIVPEVLDEVDGLGPLEPLLLLVNRLFRHSQLEMSA